MLTTPPAARPYSAENAEVRILNSCTESTPGVTVMSCVRFVVASTPSIMIEFA